jgi:SAM-dependent methyltransferase
MKFGGGRAFFSKPIAKETPPATRGSSGLDQFTSYLQAGQGLSVLDMSGASQANIVFVTGFGHRISSDDIIGTMMEHFGSDFLANQQAASNAQRFLDHALTFPDASFDAILVWDALQFLRPPLLDQTIAQLLRVLRRGGAMLVFFNADEKATSIPVYNYRIQDRKTLLQSPRFGCVPQKPQYFNNRMLERTFSAASSIKFFLTRDHLRELIVRK